MRIHIYLAVELWRVASLLVRCVVLVGGIDGGRSVFVRWFYRLKQFVPLCFTSGRSEFVLLYLGCDSLVAFIKILFGGVALLIV